MQSSRLALAAAAALVLGAACCPAQTVINSVPYTISASGKYVLGGNLVNSGSSPSAITVNAPNVILDLNGLFVSGPTNALFSYAITVNDVSNVTIRNGTLANVGYGIYFNTGSNSINHLIENVNFTRCSIAGLYYNAASPGSIVRSNSFSQIGPPQFILATYGIRTLGGVRITDNSISTVTAISTSPSAYGISAATGDFASGNTISNCQIGIDGGKYLNNLTSGCTTPFQNGINATGNN